MYFENKKFWMVVDQNVNRGCLKTGDLGRGVGQGLPFPNILANNFY